MIGERCLWCLFLAMVAEPDCKEHPFEHVNTFYFIETLVWM